MEIEMIPVSPEERLEAFENSTEIIPKQKFPWLVAILSLAIGGAAIAAVFYFRERKDKDKR